MKIIFLNTWNGRIRNDIAAYLKLQALTTDAFCFQEAYDDMKTLCAEVLSDYSELLQKSSGGTGC